MEINTYENISGLRTTTDPSEEDSRTELGQDDFLKLMTEQLANQDPFEPMENGEFMGQIAQFGAVDGINNLLTSFNDLAVNLQSSQALQASNIIGRQVLVNHDQGYLPETGTLDGAVELDSSASNTSVIEIFMERNFCGFIATSYCFNCPPHVFISTTPSIPDNCLLITQS